MSYKVTEPDGTTTVYDSNGNFKFKQDPNLALVPQGYNNALVPSNQSNALTIPGTLVGQSSDGSFGWRDALALAIEIGNMKNPFSSTGKTIGESVAEGGKQAIKWAIDKVTGKKEGAQKTTKPQTQTQSQALTRTQTKTLTRPQTQTSAIKYKTITYPGDIMGDYERESIKRFETLQRKSVPWKMPSIEAGITRMTGFEPFSATADQTFNVFYGGGSIDPFLRS